MRNSKGYKIINKTKFTMSVFIVMVVLLSLLCSAVSLYGDEMLNSGTLTSEEKRLMDGIDTVFKTMMMLPDAPVEPQQSAVEDIFPQNKTTYDFEKEEFLVTAYDLSIKSCGKKITSRSYGITRTGFNLKGHTWQTARVIATDPKVIPLHSKIFIEFIDKDYSKFSGVYTSEDTGSLVKGRHIDLFLIDAGEKVSQKAIDFGVTNAKIIILDSN